MGSSEITNPIPQNGVAMACDSRDCMSLALESSDLGFWDWNLETNQIYFSPTWKRLIGYKDEEILNTLETWLGRIHVDDINKVNADIEAHRKNSTEVFSCKYRLQHRNGSYRWMSGRGKILRSPAGDHFVGLHSDITGQRRFQEQFRYEALHDPLTGLANRILFAERLNQASKRAKREENFKFALLFLDLDKLKQVNDTLGHGVGDALIVHFSKRLRSACREVDTVARLGGDEFTVIQPNIHDLENVKNFAERILAITCQPFEVGSESIMPSVSIGITTNITGHKDAKELLRDADLALYHSKTQNGPYYSFFEERMRGSFGSR